MADVPAVPSMPSPLRSPERQVACTYMQLKDDARLPASAPKAKEEHRETVPLELWRLFKWHNSPTTSMSSAFSDRISSPKEEQPSPEPNFYRCR